MSVTTIEELAKIKNTFVVELPPFADGNKLTVELKNPSIIDMVCSGRIYNPIIGDAMKVIGEEAAKENISEAEKEAREEQSRKAKIESIKFMKYVAESCLVNPTLEDINKYTGGLTDEQIFAIFDAVKLDAVKLSKFCEVPANS